MKKTLIFCSLLIAVFLIPIIVKGHVQPTVGMWCDQSNDNPCEITLHMTGPNAPNTVTGKSTGVLRCVLIN